jgi:hypothetical protein
VLRPDSELHHRLEAIFIFIIGNIRKFHGIRISMNVFSEQKFRCAVGQDDERSG